MLRFLEVVLCFVFQRFCFLYFSCLFFPPFSLPEPAHSFFLSPCVVLPLFLYSQLLFPFLIFRLFCSKPVVYTWNFVLAESTVLAARSVAVLLVIFTRVWTHPTARNTPFVSLFHYPFLFLHRFLFCSLQKNPSSVSLILYVYDRIQLFFLPFLFF